MARNQVLLINPNRMRPPIAPVALDYLADALMHARFDPILCDLTFADDWTKTLVQALDDTNPLAIGVTVRNIDDAFMASQDFILQETARIVEVVRQHSDAPVILGGVGLSIAPVQILAYLDADYGVWGNGEQAFVALLESLAGGDSCGAIPGVLSRGARRLEGPSVCSPDFPRGVRRNFVDNQRYFREGGQIGLESKRGCNQQCIYCVEPFAKGSRVWTLGPHHVAEEMARLVDQGINVFHFCDSEFNLPRDHALDVCTAICDQGLHDHVAWYVYASPQAFDSELATAMAQAGCAGVNFGADHTDDAMLRRLGRNYNGAAVSLAIEAAAGAGIRVMVDTLFGGPGETRQRVEQAIATLKESRADCIGLSCGVRIYPNTPLAETVMDQGPLDQNPHLHGVTGGNDSLLRPIFYVDAGLGDDLYAIVSRSVDRDPRFFHTDPDDADGNYNYNDNSVLAEAIRAGARGAYWSILHDLASG